MAANEYLDYLAALAVPADNYGGGKTQMFNPIDIAGALGYAKVSEGASLYARAKYACHRSQRSKLMYWTLTNRVIPLAIKGKWGYTAEMLARITKAAMDEAIQERMKCLVCEGHGYVIGLTGKAVMCEACETDGSTAFSDAQRYQKINIMKKDWNKVRPMYREVLGIFADYDGELTNALKTNLYRQEG